METNTPQMQPISIKCPNCGAEIFIGSIDSFLSNSFFICSKCGVKLSLDKRKSLQALQALQAIQKNNDSQKKEPNSNFNV